MFIYIVNFLFNMIFGFLLLNKKNSYSYNKRKKIYLIITTIQFGLLCGFRSTKMAYDTLNYEYIFDMTSNSLSTIFVNKSYVEIGFSILCTIIKVLGGNFQTLLIVTSLFVMGCCCIFIYRHSRNVLLSVFLIISFPFYYSSFDIIRHFLALSFFLLGYKFVESKEFFKFLLFIILGSFFHSISFVFIPFYFVKNVKYNFFSFILLITFAVFCYFKIEDVVFVISSFIGKNSYISTDWINSYGGGIKTAAMYFVVFVIGFLQYNNLRKKTIEDSTSLLYILILFVFSIIFINARMMTRMIMSMIPLFAISMPNLLFNDNTINKKYSSIYLFSTLFIGIIYHAFMLITSWQNVVPYIPFWK